MSRLAIKRAHETGELPHEFLLRVCRGEKVFGEKDAPDLNARIAAAKAAAPFYAPRLSYAEYQEHDPHDARNMTDEELADAVAESTRVLALMEKAKTRRPVSLSRKKSRQKTKAR